MARLCRFVKLQDRFDAHVYTFLIPSRLLQPECHEIYCKDIVYGQQRWTVSFMKSHTHLSAYLKLRIGYSGLTVVIDYGLTLLNYQHYTKNETYVERNCKFTREECTKGRKSFICLTELLHRNFTQENGDFMIDVEMSNIRVTFLCSLQLSKVPCSNNSTNKKFEYQKIESSYFTVGLEDWSLSLNPQGDDYSSKPLICLHRHTGFDHYTYLQYRLYFGKDFSLESDLLTHDFDLSGAGPDYVLNYSLDEITNGKSDVTIRVEIIQIRSYSHVTIDVFTRAKNRTHFYDRDKQAWLIESNIEGDCLSFNLYYSNISHVPRKYTRFVCWNVSVVSTNGTTRHFQSTKDGPFCKYYIQQDLDEGFGMATNIPVSEIKKEDSPYISEEDKRLTVHVEWLNSQLLVIPNYHRLDDVSRIQRHQMQRELLALQAENLALEKQVYSYQQCLSKKENRNRHVATKNGDIIHK